MSARRPFVAGNWKMNTDKASAVELATAVARSAGDAADSVDIGVIPPFVYLGAVANAIRESGVNILLGAQDCYHESNGAFTGEVSVEMLADIGVRIVLAGHSERRHVIGETDDDVNRKVRAILAHDLQCILCIGETIEQREAGETDAVNERQLRTGLEGVPLEQLGRLTIAYEPVWAIGTGKTATPGDAQDAHAKCRAVLADLYGIDAASSIRIQYGGSMKPANASELLAQPDIDGGLIGGASLKADAFLAIVEAARSAQPA
ncbi:MAG: triose-phosphate isomerase [Planctomycetota bacterium]